VHREAGASIVSFNLESLPLTARRKGTTLNQVEQAAFAYTAALNYLLRRDPRHRQRLQIGDASVVFWVRARDETQAEAGRGFASQFFDRKTTIHEKLRRLPPALEQVSQGRPLRELNPLLKTARIFSFLSGAQCVASVGPILGNRDIGGLHAASSDSFHDLRLEPCHGEHRPPSGDCSWRQPHRETEKQRATMCFRN